MKILVTGTGRSGTTFVATTLQHLGISASHEQVYQLGARKHKEWPKQDHVEVSWAAPKFRSSWPEDMTILHLVRHPLRTIESYLNVIRGLESYKKQHWMLPELLPPGNPPLPPEGIVEGRGWQNADWVAWHYITWNRLVERYAEDRRRVEDCRLTTGPVEWILSRLEGGWEGSTLGIAYGKANRNSVNPGKNVVTMESFAEELREPLRIICEDYQYDPEETG